MRNLHSKMKLLAVKLSSLQQELSISKQILQSASTEVDEMFRKRYFPEIPVEKENSEQSEQPLAEKTEEPENDNSTNNAQDADSDQDSSPRNEVGNQKINIDPETKQLFRKIALKIHPDKLVGLEDGFEKDKKIQLFQKAVKAVEENEIIILAEIAIEIGIEPPELPKHKLEEAENKISAIKKEINHIESTYVWKWFFCTDKQQKDKILEKLFELMYAKNSRP